MEEADHPPRVVRDAAALLLQERDRPVKLICLRQQLPRTACSMAQALHGVCQILGLGLASHAPNASCELLDGQVVVTIVQDVPHGLQLISLDAQHVQHLLHFGDVQRFLELLKVQLSGVVLIDLQEDLRQTLDLRLLGHLDLPRLGVGVRIGDGEGGLHDNGRNQVPEDKDTDADEHHEEEAVGKVGVAVGGELGINGVARDGIRPGVQRQQLNHGVHGLEQVTEEELHVHFVHEQGALAEKFCGCQTA
mmetsp:Transcript_122695/g.291794  ORF Transcript_122695/g.291794 Transcript_122695/m.291794 type:complete len:249 (+) Transcript_122695:105-851(+)